MGHYFITATGTDVGKTLLGAAIACQLRKAGKAVRAVKPLLSGYSPMEIADSDSAVLLKAQGIAVNEEEVARITPWRFDAPLSPDMAAAREGTEIDKEALVAWCRAQENRGEVLLVEGVGGVMVPLNDHSSVADWMAALDYKVILVAGNYLGSISHTLSAVKALEGYGVTPHCVVISDRVEGVVSAEETRNSLKNFIPQKTAIHILPALTGDSPWQNAPDLLEWLR